MRVALRRELLFLFSLCILWMGWLAQASAQTAPMTCTLTITDPSGNSTPTTINSTNTNNIALGSFFQPNGQYTVSVSACSQAIASTTWLIGSTSVSGASATFTAPAAGQPVNISLKTSAVSGTQITASISGTSITPPPPTCNISGPATASTGDIVTLTATACTNNPVNYQWLGNPLSGQGSSQATYKIAATSGTETFSLIPANAGGSGPQANFAVSIVPKPAVPGAPIMGGATAGNKQATVTFAAPSSSGSSPITGYTVTSNPAGGVDTNAGTLGLSHVITGLTNGVSYTFTVTATNSVGTSAPSNPSNAVTPTAPIVPPTLTAPSAPIMGGATGGDARAVVSFSTPASDGGSPITGYTVTSNPAGGVDTNAGTLGLSHVITGLANGTAYTFTVTATNNIGTSPPSSPSNSITPAAQVTPPAVTPPEAPIMGTATAGNAQATVTFSPPNSDGGLPITGYTVTSSPPGGIDSGAGTLGLSHVITGLTNGVTYIFMVTATNNAGTSPPSAASNAVTPRGSALTLNLSPASLTFGTQAPGTTSAPQTVTLTNSGNSPINITGTAISGEFARTSTCGPTLAAGATCTISVTFSPTAAGARSGTLTIDSNASGSPHSIALSGSGTQQQSLSIRPTNTSPLVATPGSPLMLEVLVTESGTSSVPAVGVTVSWTANTAGDVLSGATSVTDANGRARVDLTIGNAAGGHTVRASAVGSTPYDFNVNSIISAVQEPANLVTQAMMQTAVASTQIQLANIRNRLDQIRLLRGANTNSAKVNVTAQGTAIPIDQIAAAFKKDQDKNTPQGRGASSDDFERWGFFVNGNVEIGKQTLSGGQGFEPTSRGLTAGLDYQFDGGHVIGAGLGLARVNTDLLGDSGTQRLNGHSISVYGSYVPAEKMYIDATLNLGNNNYDTDRRLLNFDGVTRETAFSSTSGKQTAFALTAGGDYHYDAVRLNPYARYEYIRATADGFTESGSSQNLMVSSQELTTNWFTAGVQASYTISTGFGVVIPQGRLEFTRQNTSNPKLVTASLVNGGNLLTLSRVDQSGNFGIAGLGVTVMLARGINAYLNYETMFGKSNTSMYRWAFGMSIPF